MNAQLWKNILDFNIDQPLTEYGFSTRLETENSWTVNFAADAVLEYKKFMYLAATSGFMVSPSEIVDVVWHQHLIFTQSYDDFCSLLGKKIVHVPSTHNRADVKVFMKAKENTAKCYLEHFGVQPSHIWEHSGIYGPLSLEKSRLKVSGIICIGLALLVPFMVCAYFLLRPLYEVLNNPYFLFGYGAIVVLGILFLHFFNRNKFRSIIGNWDDRSFVFNLTAFELLYLRKSDLTEVVHGVVNELISQNKVAVMDDGTFRVVTTVGVTNSMCFTVLDMLNQWPGLSYPELLVKMKRKPVFTSTAKAIDAFKKYFSRSKVFIGLFAINFTVWFALLLLGITRVITGIMREKPIMIIAVVVVLGFIAACFFLYRLMIDIGRSVIPEYYNLHIVENRRLEGNWEWNYYLLGSAVFATSFLPLADSSKQNSYDASGDFGDSGSSESSGCGSSCGSSCGGCGGGGD